MSKTNMAHTHSQTSSRKTTAASKRAAAHLTAQLTGRHVTSSSSSSSQPHPRPRPKKSKMSKMSKQKNAAFETRELLDYFEINSSYTLGNIAVFAVGVFVRLCVGTGSYSGMHQAPLFGDFEAQRHWMEVTWHTPACHWYSHTPDNPLHYWGLDYPPLTAYHSWLMASLFSRTLPQMIHLHQSRGLHKLLRALYFFFAQASFFSMSFFFVF